MIRTRFCMMLGSAIAFAASCAHTENASRVASDEPPQNLTVMTHNIRVGVGPDKYTAPAEPTENLKAIARLIKSQGADIVLLQEVDRGSTRTSGVDELKVLADETGMYLAWAPSIDNDKLLYGIGILSKLPIDETETIKLPFIDYSSTEGVPEYYSEQRMALVARIGGVTAIGTHLGLTKEQRMQQTETIARIAEREKKRGQFVVIGGDLNAEPDAEELGPIRNILRDVYQRRTDKHGLEYDLSIRDRLTFPALEPDRCIDYLFVSPERAKVLETVIPEETLSDHRALVARLTY